MASLASLLSACEPQLVVGAWSCPDDAGEGGAGAVPVALDALQVPWSTSFERGFCDYTAGSGYCYARGGGSYETVTSPVRSGRFAAAFSVAPGEDFMSSQTRCVRHGVLPSASFYSAYFFVPEAPSASSNWNLMHFRSGEAAPLRGLWDVTLVLDDDGNLRLSVFDFLRMQSRATSGVPAVPIASWFQIEVYLRRATDETGEFSVYQDGELALGLTELSTDNSTLGEWYVGNLARALTPSDNTLYVDDVALREAP